MEAKRKVSFSSLNVVTAGVVLLFYIEILFEHLALNPKLNMGIVPSK